MAEYYIFIGMKLQMSFDNQLQSLLPPLLIHGLGLFIFWLLNYSEAMEAPIFFKLFFFGMIGFSFLCVFIVHMNYYLYERNRKYFFGEDYFEIILKDKVHRYSHNEIRYVKIIEAGYEMYDYGRFDTRKFSFFFPSYSFSEIVLKNGNCMPISCFVHSNLEAVLKRLLPEKNIVKDLKAIPII